MKDNQNNQRNQDKPANLASQKQTGNDSHKKNGVSDKVVKGDKEPVSKQEDQQRLNAVSNQSKKVSDTPDTDGDQNDTIKEKASGAKNHSDKKESGSEKHKMK